MTGDPQTRDTHRGGSQRPLGTVSACVPPCLKPASMYFCSLQEQLAPQRRSPGLEKERLASPPHLAGPGRARSSPKRPGLGSSAGLVSQVPGRAGTTGCAPGPAPRRPRPFQTTPTTIAIGRRAGGVASPGPGAPAVAARSLARLAALPPSRGCGPGAGRVGSGRAGLSAPRPPRPPWGIRTTRGRRPAAPGPAASGASGGRRSGRQVGAGVGAGRRVAAAAAAAAAPSRGPPGGRDSGVPGPGRPLHGPHPSRTRACPRSPTI